MEYTKLGISTLQSRLGRKQDHLARKVIDNVNVRNISMPVDCIRIKADKSYEGDDITWNIRACDVIPAVFPPLEDVPIRKIHVNDETKEWQLTSMVDVYEDGKQQERFTLQVPYNYDIDVGDFIFRVLIDEDLKYPIIVPLCVSEILGTIRTHEVIMQKANCTIPTDTFPKEIVDTLKQMTERRLKLGY